MLFNSPEYFVFLIIVLILYYSLKHRLQNYMLLIVSYIFYGFWDYRFLSLIVISTLVDYMVSLHIARAKESPRKRRLLLIVSIVVNLGILGFFKYFNFFIHNTEHVLSLAGFEPHLPVLYILLPVGISFYTFQTMAYTIDVYRGKLEPVKNFFDFALYVCYFPQLVAGPIERAQNLIPAIQFKRIVTTENFTTGCTLILIGLFRKVVIADGLGGQIDPVFSAPHNYSTPEVLAAIYLFTLQIYCDFAGYTDIAIGSSRLLGIDLMENFNQPYFSSNITEFWRRWHISLSSWLKDYLYIPLGGNRYGNFNTYKNLFLTMLLGGLWHGAAWTFIVWGGLHGLYLTVHKLYLSYLGRKETELPPSYWPLGRILGLIVTFHLVMLTLIFFRAPGLGAAIEYLGQIAAFQQMEMLPTILPAILIPWLLILLIDIPQFVTGSHVVLLRWPKMVRNLAVAAMLFLVFLGVGTRAPFIYFQF
ncbi:MAG TPA: MBOAT family protein [Anaerolineae bacterium]|nr:MBOAT family protein [Anaerolineae bacterium]